MLKIIKNSKIETPEEIAKEYPKCMYILTDFTDINDIKGHLYAISPNKNLFVNFAFFLINYQTRGKFVSSWENMRKEA